MYKEFKVHYKQVDYEFINNIWNYCKERNYHIYYNSYEDALKDDNKSLQLEDKYPLKAFIKDNQYYFSITYKLGKKWKSYNHYKLGDNIDNNNKRVVLPGMSWLIFYKKTHLHTVENMYGYKKTLDNKVIWSMNSLGGYKYRNEEYKNQELNHCYEYDINSTYLAFASKGIIPDTTQVFMNTIPQDNQVGFNLDGLPQVNKKRKCRYVFNLIYSQELVDYCKYILDKMKVDKDSAKIEYCQTFGMMQRHNPFVRNYIIGIASNFIKNLIDDNSIYCNTDSIISISKRYDLDIGDEIGKFKVKHNDCSFKYNDSGYQWLGENPRIQGVSQKILEGKDLFCYDTYVKTRRVVNWELQKLEEINND